MELRERLRRALELARGLTERMLDDFQTAEQWMTPPVDGMHHALWIVGHLAVADNRFVSMINPSAGEPNTRYIEQFGKGSRPLFDVDQYDSPDQIRDYMRERRGTFLNLLDSLPEDQFRQPAPSEAPPFMYDLASIFQMAAWHEALHTGQLTAIRRKLGYRPVA